MQIHYVLLFEYTNIEKAKEEKVTCGATDCGKARYKKGVTYDKDCYECHSKCCMTGVRGNER